MNKLSLLSSLTIILFSQNIFASTSPIVIVPNDKNVNAVLESLAEQGFELQGDLSCAPSASALTVTQVGENTLEVSCSKLPRNKIKAIPLHQLGSATGDPNEFEGTATGDPNEFEGTATGDPNEFEGSATGDPNEFEGTATGDPNEFEGTATGAKSSRNVVVKSLGRIENAARTIHARIFYLLN